MLGAELDTAVAVALGWQKYAEDGKGFVWCTPGQKALESGEFMADEKWSPSTRWSEGGPLIDAFEIGISSFITTSGETMWGGAAAIPGSSGKHYTRIQDAPDFAIQDGPTALVAAMRTLVEMKTSEAAALKPNVEANRQFAAGWLWARMK